MRRWRERLEEFGYDGLFDRRRGRPSPKRVALATVGQDAGTVPLGLNLTIQFFFFFVFFFFFFFYSSAYAKMRTAATR